MPPTFPKLRGVDVRPYVHNGQPYFLLRDPLGLSEGSLLVPQALGPVLALCDGSLENARALSAALAVRYGIGVDAALIEELLTALDEACLLQNERTQQALRRKAEMFRQQPFRPAALAGLSYAADKNSLARQLDGYVNGFRPNGADPSPRAVGAQRRRAPHAHPGIFSPHIDYPRGGTVYAQAWSAAAEQARAADLAIVVGTDHYGDDLFTLTRQNYATPFGVLPTATAIVDDLAAALGEDAVYAGELRHLREHSIELVAVWLHHVRGGRPVEMVPVLCGSLHRFYDGTQRPADDPAIQTFLDTLLRHCRGRNVFVVASGDLAHVGPAFGGAPLTAQERARVRADDEILVRHLCDGDAGGFFDAIRRTQNRNNVCGTTPGYLALHLMGNVSGVQHGYRSCPADEIDTSAVTVCGVVFT